MPEKDTSNLPILDDIIVPGDAEKAAIATSNKDQSSLLTEDDSAETAVSRSAEPIANQLEADDKDRIGHTASPIAEHDDEAAVVRTFTPLAADTNEAMSQTSGHLVDGVTPAAEVEPESNSAPDIDTLTDEILNGVMPAVEHLLSEKIRQILKQHLAPANTDVD